MKPCNACPSIATADGVRGSVFLLPWALVLTLLVAPTTVQAQDQPPCEDAVEEAVEFYVIESFEEAISRLQECLNRSALTGEDKKFAHEILAKSYLKLGSEDQARAALLALLTFDRNYEPDLFEDQEYKNLVDEVKLTAGFPVAEKKSGLFKWLAIGGGAVAGTVTAAVLLGSNGGGGNGSSLPLPPGRPGN